MTCKKNEQFNPMASGCPKTCENPEGEEMCLEPPVQACECKEGFVLSDMECVKPKDCGCSDTEVGYLKVSAVTLLFCPHPERFIAMSNCLKSCDVSM